MVKRIGLVLIVVLFAGSLSWNFLAWARINRIEQSIEQSKEPSTEPVSYKCKITVNRVGPDFIEISWLDLGMAKFTVMLGEKDGQNAFVDKTFQAVTTENHIIIDGLKTDTAYWIDVIPQDGGGTYHGSCGGTLEVKTMRALPL